MIERLPTPWGLVRSGVAPDHPKIKSVTRVYEKTAAHPRFRYFGNVTFGEHVSRAEMLERYHAVVYATGSPSDRALGIPGEELPGSHAATEFVGWYNGHPDFTDLEVDLLSAERAVIIGNGNVALDVARMLVLAPEELAPTDTADHALEVLARNSVREVQVLGRRGPAQAAFTNPELIELADLEEADVIVDEAELERALAVEDPNVDTTAKRNVEILRDYASREPQGRPKRIVLRFLLSPTALIADESGRLGRRRAGPQRARGRRRGEPAGTRHRGARDAAGGPRVPGDRLPRHRPAGRALRRALGGDPERERPGARPGHRGGDPGRVRRGLDQAGTHGGDRDQQEGRPGDRRRDPGRPRAPDRPRSRQRRRRRPATSRAGRRPRRSRSCSARASRTWSPTAAGRRSTATSARSASRRAAPGSS